jgi:hypothetical protein
MAGVHEGYSYFLTREVSILLNEAINIEERCVVCLRLTKEQVQL